MGKSELMNRNFNSHYGGDEVSKADDESQKLYINDCRRRQGALYPSFMFKSPTALMLLGTPDAIELLALSGQSRLHLHLRQLHNGKHSEQADILSKNDNIVYPDFPKSLEEEATAFRKHGLPLLVWPSGCTVEEVQTFLNTHYPDCGMWFTELQKATSWLEKKWKPLAECMGIQPIDSTADERSFKGPEVPFVQKDSVATTYVHRRLKFYTEYTSLLQSYFAHRRLYTPGFQFHSLHRKLVDACEARKISLKDDSGFLNVVGNRLLHFTQSSQLPSDRTLEEFLQLIEDPLLKQQCYQSFISAKSLKELLKKNEKQIQENLDAVSYEIRRDDSSEIDEINSGAEDAEKEKSQSYPNRPITWEIMENRGLVKYRHKRERNPRVHLRHKFRKATIRYRSRAPPIRHEETPYAGEAKGIRVHLIKSHKFKAR
ncbi:hypothetical protein FGIG_08580 [Fasciola gigantica]|uniref:Sas10 C-terminal domain-containing protein n=1 Tax=Fasciola gigantica TaxID=46835 RepID=A0A504YI93_FASGI|nr:hypothetical protein FGIG_08580 [Fasciola gigantica]